VARPTFRVLALLELLQSGGTRTVAELADRLGVDERTARRYVGHLLDMDVPVESVRGGTAATGWPRATGCPR
jgi:predicted DNA-binding transcriptional regulator YafY